MCSSCLMCFSLAAKSPVPNVLFYRSFFSGQRIHGIKSQCMLCRTLPSGGPWCWSSRLHLAHVCRRCHLNQDADGALPFDLKVGCHCLAAVLNLCNDSSPSQTCAHEPWLVNLTNDVLLRKAWVHETTTSQLLTTCFALANHLLGSLNQIQEASAAQRASF